MASTINAKNTSSGLVLTPDASGQLELQTADTTRMTITSSGNVGIGTSSPSERLDVRTNTTGDTNINIQNDYSGAAYAANLNLLAANTTGSYFNAVVAKNSAGTATWKIDGAGVANTFRISTGSSFTERMRIDSSGNVLVGTTAEISGSGTSDWGVNLIRNSDTGYIKTKNKNTAATYAAVFYNANGAVGNITTNASATAYNTSSDYRLKENVQPMVGALDTIAQLKPVTYDWIADGSSGQGFIAHELAEVVPDCVTGKKDAVDADGNPIYQGIDTSFLVATLTAAIQEQQELIKQLQAELAELKGAA